VLEYLPHPIQILMRLRKMLAKVWSAYHSGANYNELNLRLTNNYEKYNSPNYHCVFYAWESLKRLLVTAGFKGISKFDCHYCFDSSILAKTKGNLNIICQNLNLIKDCGACFAFLYLGNCKIIVSYVGNDSYLLCWLGITPNIMNQHSW